MLDGEYIDKMEDAGLLFVGRDPLGERMEVCTPNPLRPFKFGPLQDIVIFFGPRFFPFCRWSSLWDSAAAFPRFFVLIVCCQDEFADVSQDGHLRSLTLLKVFNCIIPLCHWLRMFAWNSWPLIVALNLFAFIWFFNENTGRDSLTPWVHFAHLR